MRFADEWDYENRRYKREEARNQWKYTWKAFDDMKFEDFFKEFYDSYSYTGTNNRNNSNKVENVDSKKADRIAKVQALLNDPAATDGEKQACRNILKKLEVCM